MSSRSVSVVIMAWNEEANLPHQLTRTLAYLSRTFPESELIVVDDGSQDGTAAVVEEAAARDARVRLIRHPENRGMGAAIRSGYGAATKRWVTQLPADGQVNPRVFDGFLPHLDEVPLILSRYADRGDGLTRRVLTRGFQLTNRLLLGHPCDYTGTMFFRRDLLARSTLSSDTFFANIEFPLGLIKAGVPHRFVTIEPPEPRRHGDSRVVNVRRISRVLGEIIRYRIRGPRPRA
jgi:glycosyltransferase involved in cell wall biosynthesis